MARSVFCSKCKKEKEPGRDNESCCKACKSEAGKARRAERRLEAGLRPIGSGPNPNCKCGKVKERIESRECNECHRKRDGEWRLRTGRTKRHQTGRCRCGNEFASYSKCYCSDCASKWRREYLDKNPDQKIRIYDRCKNRKFYSPDELIKYWARYTTSNAIRLKLIIKGPCEVCGVVEKVEAHHDDYTRPLDIRWLCKLHHAEHHKDIT